MSEQQSAREHHRGIAQRLASNLAGLAHNHLSLFGLELQDEKKERLVKVLILVLVGAFVVWLGLAVLSVALVWWVAEEWRWAALLGVAIVYLPGGRSASIPHGRRWCRPRIRLHTRWMNCARIGSNFCHEQTHPARTARDAQKKPCCCNLKPIDCNWRKTGIR